MVPGSISGHGKGGKTGVNMGKQRKLELWVLLGRE